MCSALEMHLVRKCLPLIVCWLAYGFAAPVEASDRMISQRAKQCGERLLKISTSSEPFTDSSFASEVRDLKVLKSFAARGAFLSLPTLSLKACINLLEGVLADRYPEAAANTQGRVVTAEPGVAPKPEAPRHDPEPSSEAVSDESTPVVDEPDPQSQIVQRQESAVARSVNIDSEELKPANFEQDDEMTAPVEPSFVRSELKLNQSVEVCEKNVAKATTDIDRQAAMASIWPTRLRSSVKVFEDFPNWEHADILLLSDAGERWSVCVVEAYRLIDFQTNVTRLKNVASTEQTASLTTVAEISTEAVPEKIVLSSEQKPTLSDYENAPRAPEITSQTKQTLPAIPLVSLETPKTPKKKSRKIATASDVATRSNDSSSEQASAVRTVRYVDADALSVRVRPGKSHKRVYTIKRNERVEVITTDGGWSMVKGARYKGWVHSGFLTARPGAPKPISLPATAAVSTSSGFDGPSLKAARQTLIERSIARYRGQCPCPYSTMKSGNRCGKRSAHSKPGGAAPLCFPSDVSDEKANDYLSRQ